MTARVRFLNLFFLFWASLIVIRLVQWQIFNHEKFLSLAESQHYGFFEIPAKRGEIKTSDGYSIVTNKGVFLIYAQVTEIKSVAKKQNKTYETVVKEITRTLSPLLVKVDAEEKTFKPEEELREEKALIEAKEKELEEKFLKRGAVWVPIRHKAPEWLVEKIKELKLPGFGFEKESTRLYPEASLAAHLLGFVGSDSTGGDKGYFGLEGYYDREIRGRSGRLREEIDALGRPILVGERVGIDSIDGRSLTTTIDRGVQYIVEKELEKGIKKFGAKSASAIVMDPNTGEILALANFPKYDPAKWNYFSEDSYKNPVVADSYEPGSTFKLITFAAGLNEGKITPETKCESCNGPKKVGGFTITTWNNKYYADSTMLEVLQHSDNVGASEVAEKLGKEKMVEYIKDFGFGERTGVDLEEEASGIVKEKGDWQPIDLDTASFGQGVSVTALQMVRAVGAIANGGKLMKPFIVKEIEGRDRTIDIRPKLKREVIKETVAKVLAEVMVKVVEGGETRNLVPKGYRVAGKTGTAQIPIEGRYDPKRTIASFVGFAPVEDPRYVMLVRYTEPSSSPYGAETAAPTFFDITKELFNYWGIPPNR